MGISRIDSFSQITLRVLQPLTIEEQRKIIQKIEVGQIKQGQELRELVVEIKKLPKKNT